MEQKTILLLNVVAIQFIAIFSDYWLSIQFRSTSPPNCQLKPGAQLARLECGNSTYTLIRQHANLFRQCNDIPEGHRRNLSRNGALYPSACHWFLIDQKFLSRSRVETNFVLDLTAFLISIVAPLTAIFGYFFSKSAIGVIRSLSVSTFASFIPVVITMFIIHSTNTLEPLNEEQFLYFVESDWSLLCAALGGFLMGLTTHICMVEHRLAVERQQSQRRRRQLHNALMSSCRQDIAMAIRARMTVI